jgi:hypothetical protein
MSSRITNARGDASMNTPFVGDIAELPSDGDRSRRRSLLRAIRWVALVDLAALAAYLFALDLDYATLAFWTGLACAAGFVALLAMTGAGATLGLWGWWYSALVFITAGGIGALLGRTYITHRGWHRSPDDPAGGFMVGGFGGGWPHHGDGGSDLGGGDAGGGDAGANF